MEVLQLAVLMEAERLRAEGVDLIDLGAGEPDFPTPATSKDAAEQHRKQFHTFTLYERLAPLRKAITEMMHRDFGAATTRRKYWSQWAGKQALFNAMATLLNPGDEVLIPSPYWVTFPEIVKFLPGDSGLH